MKKVSLKSVRESFKSVNNGSMFTIIKGMYAVLTDEKTGKVTLPNGLKGVLPANKKQALSEAQSIIDWGKVGTERIIKRTDKNGCTTEIHTTIKPSADIVLRYYVAKANGTI